MGPDQHAAPSPAATSASGDSEESTAETVMALARMAELALGEVKLSLTQYRLLRYLLRGRTIQSDLAFQLAVTKQSVTRVVDSLVARGLVTRRVDAKDKRRVVHQITAKGRRLCHDADQRIEYFYYLVVERDLTDRDRATVARAIRIIHRSVESGRERIPALPPGATIGEPRSPKGKTRRLAH